jgi:hypothetical protein
MAKWNSRQILLAVSFLVAGITVTTLPFLLLPTAPPASHNHLPAHKALESFKRTPNKPSPRQKGISSLSKTDRSSNISKSTCALCFFGLPRSFELLVLPSIVQNVLIPNKENHCDIYLHYYNDLVEEKADGRSGNGGTIDPKQVLKLQQQVQHVYSNSTIPPPHVSFTMDTSETFISKRGNILKKYKTKLGPDGNYTYYPWKATSYNWITIDNIVKQWHSIQTVWEDMEQTMHKLGTKYTRVSMMRNDVVYVTRFDIHKIDKNTSDLENRFVVVPDYARFPINDRMVYGPYEAVKIWATERFQRLEDHVVSYEPGYGMHSERFLNHSIFPAIRDLGFSVIANPDLCFFRARADGATWIKDCTTRNGATRGFRTRDKQQLMEELLGRPCHRQDLSSKITQLYCRLDEANRTTF